MTCVCVPAGVRRVLTRKYVVCLPRFLLSVIAAGCSIEIDWPDHVTDGWMDGWMLSRYADSARERWCDHSRLAFCAYSKRLLHHVRWPRRRAWIARSRVAYKHALTSKLVTNPPTVQNQMSSFDQWTTTSLFFNGILKLKTKAHNQYFKAWWIRSNNFNCSWCQYCHSRFEPGKCSVILISWLIINVFLYVAFLQKMFFYYLVWPRLGLIGHVHLRDMHNAPQNLFWLEK